MLTSPWRTGSLVCAAAAAIGALPSPASFEKIPRATPFCIATSILPTAPPVIAFGENAASIIVTNAAGTFVILVITRIKTNTTYIIAINGTIIWLTLAILFTPPISTAITHNASIRLAITTDHEYSPIKGMFTQCTFSGSNKPFTALEIPFTWLNVPIPKSPTHTPKKANILASHFHLCPIPCSM